MRPTGRTPFEERCASGGSGRADCGAAPPGRNARPTEEVARAFLPVGPCARSTKVPTALAWWTAAGLAVAALAGLKIVLYDLANLEALYRVGSFFALAMIALAVAYAYNQRARVGQHP